MITIIMATIEDMTGLSMVMISQLLPGIFLCAYMLGMLAWSRTVSSDGRFVTSMMLASTPYTVRVVHPSIFYETLVVFMLPVFYFIIWKRGTNQNRFKFLAVLMLLFFIFGHPLVTVGILVSIIVILGMELLLKQEVKLVSIPFLIYGVMAFLLWILFNVNLVRDLENTLNQLLGLLEGSSTFSNAQSQASSVGILSALRSIIICTLDDIIYVLITLVLALVIWRRGWRNHPMNIMMACFLGGSAFLAIIILFTFAHNPFRMINLNFVMIFSVPSLATSCMP